VGANQAYFDVRLSRPVVGRGNLATTDGPRALEVRFDMIRIVITSPGSRKAVKQGIQYLNIGQKRARSSSSPRLRHICEKDIDVSMSTEQSLALPSLPGCWIRHGFRWLHARSPDNWVIARYTLVHPFRARSQVITDLRILSQVLCTSTLVLSFKRVNRD
jgi:hypothetical protein